MTVKEVVLSAATQVGCREEVEEYLDGLGVQGQKKTELLVDCFNIVENELALDYLPLYAEERIRSTGAKVQYDGLSKNVVRIVAVKDEQGKEVKFKVYPTYLEVAEGGTTIVYTYTPEKKTIDDDSDFYLYVSPRLLSYGVASEYCLALGLFEEAAIWDKKYKDAIESIYHSSRGRKIKSRRWV